MLSAFNRHYNETIQQADIATTVSALLGVPFPHHAIGTVLFDLLKFNSSSTGSNDVVAQMHAL